MGELIQAADRLAEGEFSVSDLTRETGWGKSKTYAVLGRAEELGCIGEGDTRGRYQLLKKQAEAPLNLPPKIRLTAADFRISTEIPPSRPPDFPHFHSSTESTPLTRWKIGIRPLRDPLAGWSQWKCGKNACAGLGAQRRRDPIVHHKPKAHRPRPTSPIYGTTVSPKRGSDSRADGGVYTAGRT